MAAPPPPPQYASLGAAAAANGTSSAAGGHGHGGGHVPPTDAVLFILVCFSCGVLIRLGLRWTRIPYTAMLLLVGLGIGFLQLAHPATTAFTNTLQLWLRMEPHLLLLVFLPIIGFSAAIAQEPHMLRKSWGQIMLLAWPGVVSQFLLIAMCAKWFFPYNWTWPESFLFGAMMSATDPVAVVAVLQEVGASQKLACVIDGESLMNDGSALVIFLILQKFVEGERVTVGGAVAQFCLLAVVGCLLGFAFGVGTSWLLEHIFRDPTLTTVVTLLSAYASYYCADGLVGASGLLAVVCNGFTMSLIGGRQITMRAEESMHAFWSVLEWGANTILFVWMGILLAIVLPPSHEATSFTNLKIHLVPSDAGYMFVLFLWLQVSRALLIVLCWLPFRYTGYPLTWRSALVYVWAGLRGAVGMVMALFIFLDDKIHDESFRSYCVFYMGTMAFLTILINGGTCKQLLRVLGFMSYTPEQLTTLQHVVQDMDAMRDRQIAELGPDEVLGEPEPDAVKVWTSLPTGPVLAQAAASTVRARISAKGPAAQAAITAGLDPVLLYDYRCRILHMLKAHYSEAYANHLLSTMQVRTLQAATDKALDCAGESLTDWALLEPQCQLRGLPALLRRWRAHRVSGTLVQAAVYRQNLDNLTLLVGFIHAHRHAQDVMTHHIKAVGDEPVVSAAILSRASRQDSFASAAAGGDPMKELLERFNSADSLAGARGGAEALFVLQESQQEVAAAIALAERLTSSHPSLPAWLRSKQVAAIVLTEQHHFLQHLADAGLVQPREMMLLEDMMHERFHQLLTSNTGLSAAWQYSRSRPPINLLPLFDSLDDEQAAQLTKEHGTPLQPGHSAEAAAAAKGARALTWRVFFPEQVIALAGGQVDDVLVVTKGAVRMQFPPSSSNNSDDGDGGTPHTVVASVGDALGVCELMLGGRRAATLTADSMAQVLVVPAAVFLRLVDSTPGVYERAWQATGAQLTAQHHHLLGEHRQLAPLNMFFRSCIVERMQPGQAFEVPRTALLLTGSVRSLLPLPAQFMAAVSDFKRSVSAADMLWPSNAGAGTGSQGSLATQSHQPGSARYRARPPGSTGSSGRSGGGLDRQCSAPSALPDGEHAVRVHSQHSALAPHSFSINGDSPPLSPAGGSSDSLTGSQSSSAAAKDTAQHTRVPVLGAPSELPPGEFECLEAAMVLQVPRGTHQPGTLETTTFQAQVLGRSLSVHPDKLQTQSSLGGSDSASGEGSSRQQLRSPIKDALNRLSRVTTRRRESGGGGGNEQQQQQQQRGQFRFLQRALQSNLRERQHAAAQAAHKHAHTPAAAATLGVRAAPAHTVPAGAGAAPLAGLHTVVEVRSAASNRPAAAAPIAVDSAAGQVAPRRSSGELRATDVVLQNAQLRKRLLRGSMSAAEGAGDNGGGGGGGAAAGPASVASDASGHDGDEDGFLPRGRSALGRSGSGSGSGRHYMARP